MFNRDFPCNVFQRDLEALHMLSFEGDPKINIWRLEDGYIFKSYCGSCNVWWDPPQGGMRRRSIKWIHWKVMLNWGICDTEVRAWRKHKSWLVSFQVIKSPSKQCGIKYAWTQKWKYCSITVRHATKNTLMAKGKDFVFLTCSNSLLSNQ